MKAAKAGNGKKKAVAPAVVAPKPPSAARVALWGAEAAGLPALRGGHIRVKAMVALLDRGRALLADGRDRLRGDYYWLLPGGGVEFGETTRAAALREFEEEVGEPIDNLRLLGVFENIFLWEGKRGHEIIYVYAADFADRSLYDRVRFDGVESGGERFTMRWVALDALGRPEAVPLYPPGLLEALLREAGS